eukprot:8822402-Alexandrium_andersonii.AAC.1
MTASCKEWRTAREACVEAQDEQAEQPATPRSATHLLATRPKTSKQSTRSPRARQHVRRQRMLHAAQTRPSEAHCKKAPP